MQMDVEKGQKEKEGGWEIERKALGGGREKPGNC